MIPTAITEIHEDGSFAAVETQLEGLHIENCPNLTFEAGIAPGFPYLKSIYIDNIKVNDPILTQEEWRIPFKKRSYTFNLDDMRVLEQVEIKNCKGKLFYISHNGYYYSSLKSIKLENLSFNDMPVSSVYEPSTIDLLVLGNLIGTNNLKGIKLENIQNLNFLNIAGDVALEQVEINKCDVLNISVVGIECGNFIIKYGDERYSNLFTGDVKIDSLYAEYCQHTWIDNCNISKLHLANSSATGDYLGSTKGFSLIKGLKNVWLEHSDVWNANFNGCNSLQNIIWYRGGARAEGSPSTIDIRNTPQLQTFHCISISFSELLFDEHFNSIDADCSGCSVLQEIPDIYNPEGGGSFSYDQRYKYDWEENPYTHEMKLIVTDLGRGWWYPGEPEKGYHGRD